MSREQRRGHAAMTAEDSAGTPGPRWRARLEARWQTHVQEVTELSLAYHVEAALARLAAGRFGSCEQCGSPIPAGLLTAAPQTRYCPRCDAPSAEPPSHSHDSHEAPPAEAGQDGVRPLAG